MKKMRSKHIFTLVIYLFLAVVLKAADLPKLPVDPAVTKGVLPNGMSYYLVSNPTSKGLADFALVQRTGRKTSSDIQPVALAQNLLADVPQIGRGISPQKFFSSNGARPDSNGFVKVDDDYTLYHFTDMSLSLNSSSLDSALVVLIGMADKLAKSQEPQKWYCASDNAIIISGDIDSKAVASKLQMLSYLTPAAESQPRKSYVWETEDVPSYLVQKSPEASFSEVRVMWRAPRVPDQYVGTLQPYIQKMYIAMLGDIAVQRIKSAFEQQELPYADVTYRHTASSDKAGDERFMVKVVAEPKALESVIDVIAQTLSALESQGAGREELELARRRYLKRFGAGTVRTVKDNSRYVEQCVNAFLLGVPVVNKPDVLKAYTANVIEPERQQELFKNIADALLDPRANLTLTCTSPEDVSSARCETLFQTAWEAGKAQLPPPSVQVSDTLRGVFVSPKVSLKSAKKDYLSGGTLWTFSNGFKVIYKKMDTAGTLYWALGLGGGYGSIADLNKGEGAFVADILKCFRIAGMSGEDFWKFMELGKMDMNVKVSLSSTVLSGNVPAENLRLMLRSLLALANERELDGQAYAEYMSNEHLRLAASVGSVEDRKAIMDSLMCPNYKYSPIKSRGKLSHDLLKKAGRFYDDRFSKMNDGTLVLVGDMDEGFLRKELLSHVGLFKTDKSAFYRPATGYQPVSGCSTHVVEGTENSVYLTLSVPLALTAENKMASEVAAIVLETSLAKALDATGMYVNVYSNTITNPQERFNLMISLKEASREGFAEGVEQGGALEALDILRTVLHGIESTEVTDAVVKVCKEWLKNDLAYRMKSPEYWIDVISMRQLEGKDFTTDYKARVDAVTTAKVKQILSSLNNASKVEYIIRTK
jgi:zinc protease